ncbi:DsbA family oxidoreductase [Inhella sp.]|uniref:DsbA family oxidoreductase n=1 Tax=Inhella sp. TaxID=1921806 RepID=UPI0035B452C6
MTRLEIDFISDIACPWCAIGLQALEQALRNIGPELEVELRFQPFELNPRMPREGEDVREHLKAKYGIDDARIDEGAELMRQRGAALGFHFGPRSRIWNTFDAHRLLHAAGLQDLALQRSLKHALLQAYHGEGLNPSDPDLLRRVAQAAGMDAATVDAVLASDLHAREVREAENFWLQSGIQAVPAVVLNRQHLISGGQPVEVFERALREVGQLASPRPT